jgi:hypothetical protein
MKVEIGAEVALFPEKEYISGIFVAVHVCNIGLIPIAEKINYFVIKADVWMTALLLQCFCQYFFMKLGEAFC